MRKTFYLLFVGITGCGHYATQEKVILQEENNNLHMENKQLQVKNAQLRKVMEQMRREMSRKQLRK